MVGAERFELSTSCTPSKRASQATLRPDRNLPAQNERGANITDAAPEFNQLLIPSKERGHSCPPSNRPDTNVRAPHRTLQRMAVTSSTCGPFCEKSRTTR